MLRKRESLSPSATDNGSDHPACVAAFKQLLAFSESLRIIIRLRRFYASLLCTQEALLFRVIYAAARAVVWQLAARRPSVFMRLRSARYGITADLRPMTVYQNALS